MLLRVNGKSRFSRAKARPAARSLLFAAVFAVFQLPPISVAQDGKPEQKAEVKEEELASESGSVAKEKPPRLGLVVEAKAAGAKVYTSIPGARTTLLAAARESEYGLRLFTDVEWREKAYDLREFYAAAESTADAVVDAMEPQFLRDSREVIEYALIRSQDVFLSSALTSKRFLPRFEREFGRDLRVIAVDRHILYVFPAIGGKLEAYAAALAEIYRTTPFPGSLEVFQVNEDGYRVVATLDSTPTP